MLADEIKKEFFKKMGELFKAAVEMEKFEKQSGLSSDELIDRSNKDYLKLLDKSTKIDDEINALLVQTKYFPIFLGLSKYIIGEKGKVNLKEFIEDIIKIKAKDIKKEDIEIFLEDIFESKKNGMIRRIQMVSPIILDVYLDTDLDYLYREVKESYVFGYFKASCALCRTIAESVAKKYIMGRGYGHLLKEGVTQEEKMSIPAILKSRLSIPTDILKLYSNIISKADNVLHKKDEKADEEDALNSIELLHLLIEKFPRTL